MTQSFLSQTLIIAPTSSRVDELQKEYSKKHKFLKVITLTHLVDELFEIYDDSSIVLDDSIALLIIYHLIQDAKSKYFSYLTQESESLKTLYEFFVKLELNSVKIKDFEYAPAKEKALKKLFNGYKNYKKKHTLADKADRVKTALKYIKRYIKTFESVYVDSFKVGEITLYQSALEKELLESLKTSKGVKSIARPRKRYENTLYHNSAFNSYDEVRVAIKIAKKLLLAGESEDEIVIVTSDFAEYAPYYYNLLDEYGMKGYDTIGKPLSRYSTNKSTLKHHSNFRVQKSYYECEDKLSRTLLLAKHLQLPLERESLWMKLIQTSVVRESKEGVLFSDPNKFLGTQQRYKHIIFIGTDITHFPPKSSDNFLYTQQEAQKLFYHNNIFNASKTLYDELKRLSDTLYVVTATYKGKRKLSASIILGKTMQKSFDIDSIMGRADILKAHKKIEDSELLAMQKSLSSKSFTHYDGADLGVFSHGDKLSASALNSYERCPMQYYFSSVLGLAQPENEIDGFDAAQRGSLMHLCFELFVKRVQEKKLQSVDKDLLYKEMLAVSFEAYNAQEIQKMITSENINHKIDLAVLQNGLDDTQSEQKAELAKFVDYFVENEFEFFTKSYAEEFFMLDDHFRVIELGDLDIKREADREKIEALDREKRFIKGFIDRVDNLSERVNIIDYKSSVGSKKMADFKAESLRDYQLGIYMLYAMQKYPDKTYEAHLLSFKSSDNKTSKRYYNTSISLSTQEGSKNLFDKNYENTLKKQIKEIQTKINSGDFRFNKSDEKVCEYCNFQHICHQAVLDKEVVDEER